MNRPGLIEALSRDTELPISKAKEVMKTVFNTTANALAHGDRVDTAK